MPKILFKLNGNLWLQRTPSDSFGIEESRKAAVMFKEKCTMHFCGRDTVIFLETHSNITTFECIFRRNELSKLNAECHLRPCDVYKWQLQVLLTDCRRAKHQIWHVGVLHNIGGGGSVNLHWIPFEFLRWSSSRWEIPLTTERSLDSMQTHRKSIVPNQAWPLDQIAPHHEQQCKLIGMSFMVGHVSVYRHIWTSRLQRYPSSSLCTSACSINGNPQTAPLSRWQRHRGATWQAGKDGLWFKYSGQPLLRHHTYQSRKRKWKGLNIATPFTP